MNVHTLSLFPGSLHDEQALSNGRTQSIQAENCAFRIFLLQFRDGHLGALNGLGHSGGETQIQNILPLLQNWLKVLPVD